MSLNRLLLLLGSWITITSAARYSAFISPPTTSWRVASNNHKSMEERSSLLPVPASGGSRVKGVSLRAEKKAAAKKSTKKKTTAPAPEEDNDENNMPAVVPQQQQVFKKAEFVASVAEKTGCTRAEAEDAISAVFDTLAEQMAMDKKITLVGFGTFQAKERAARKGRNPRTGEEIDIRASKAPSFSASKTLKNQINGIEE